MTAIKDRQSHQGYIVLQKALTSYFENYIDSDRGSQLTLQTTRMQREYGFSASDIGVAYIQVIHAALMNVVPTIFWVLVNVFSRPELLADLRVEALGAIKQRALSDGRRQISVEVGRLETLCPKLTSVFRETLRLTSVSTLYRRVLEDTSVSENIDGVSGRSYLLKKGVTIMISKIVGSRNPALWEATGAPTDAFDPERFLHWTEKKTGADAAARKKAYYPFGGGKELCPGRNFAATEVLGLMVVLLNGFEITSAAKVDAPIALPHPAKPKMTTGVMHPDKKSDLRARIRRRPGWENVEWSPWGMGDT